MPEETPSVDAINESEKESILQEIASQEQEPMDPTVGQPPQENVLEQLTEGIEAGQANMPQELTPIPQGQVTSFPQDGPDISTAAQDAAARERAKTNPISDLSPDRRATKNPAIADASTRELKDATKFVIQKITPGLDTDPYVEAALSMSPWEHWWEGAKAAPQELGYVGDVMTGVHKASVNTFYNFPVDIYNAITGEDVDTVDVEELYGRAEGVASALFEGIGQFMAIFVPVAGVAGKATQGLRGTMRVGGGTITRNRQGLSLGTAAAYGATSVGAGAIADATAFDPSQGNLSTFLVQSDLVADLPTAQRILEFTDSSRLGDDPKERLYGRMLNALEGAPLGIFFDGMLRGVSKLKQAMTPLDVPHDLPGFNEAGRPLSGDKPVEWSRPSALEQIGTVVYDRLSSETKRLMKEAAAFTTSRMGRAQELYSGLESRGDIPMILEREGWGLDKYMTEHVVPAFAGVVKDEFNMTMEAATELVEDFVKRGASLSKLFIGGGNSQAGSRQVLFQESQGMGRLPKDGPKYAGTQVDLIGTNALRKDTTPVLDQLEEYSQVRFTTPQRALASVLMDTQKAQYGDFVAAGDYSIENANKLAGRLAAEIMFELDPRRIEQSGLGWYSQNYQRGLELLPEGFGLSAKSANPTDRSLFTMFVAMTSDGVAVEENYRFAADLFAQYKTTGQIPKGNRASITNPDEKGTAEAFRSIKKNLAKLQRIKAALGNDNDALADFFATDFPVAELKQKAVELGLASEKSLPNLGYLVRHNGDVVSVPGSMMLGGKLGAFHGNLSGNPGLLTSDRWFNRTINRHRGAMLSEPTASGEANVRQLLGMEDAEFEDVLERSLALQKQYQKKDYKHPDHEANVVAVATDLGMDIPASGKISPQSKLYKQVREAVVKQVRKYEAGDARRGSKPSALSPKRQMYEDLMLEYQEKSANTFTKDARGLRDAPDNNTDRMFQWDAMKAAAEIVSKETGMDVSVADAQAILWYYEKRLFESLGGGSARDVAYDDAIKELITGDKHAAFRETLRKDGFTFPELPGGTGSGGGAAAGGGANGGAARSIDGGDVGLVPGKEGAGTHVLHSGVKGRAEIDFDSGVAFIRGLAGPDATTAVHEFGHALQGQLIANGDPKVVAEMNRAWDIGEEGWTRDKLEQFARDFEQIIKDPENVDPAQRDTLRYLAAQMRDIYRDAKDVPDLEIPDEIRTFFSGLERRTDLPIRFAPGKYMQPIDWTDVVAKVADFTSRGIDWRDEITPEDVLGVARMGKAGERQGPGNIRPGLDEEQGSVLRYDGMERSEGGTYQIRTDDDLLRIVAAYEDLAREIRRQELGTGRLTEEEVQEDALRMFNGLIGRGDDDMEKTMAQWFESYDPMDKAGRAQRVVALNMTLIHQLKQVKALAERADRTRRTTDYAKLQRSFIQLQYVQAQAQRMRSAAGMELYAWKMPTMMPSEKELQQAVEAGNFLKEIATDSPRSQDLVNILQGVKQGRDGLLQIAEISSKMDSPYRNATSWASSLFMESWTNWLLSGPRTWFGLSLVSPVLTATVDGMSKLIGAGVRGDTRTMAEVGNAFVSQFNKWAEAGRYALHALRDEKGHLMADASLLEPKLQTKTLSAEGFGADPESWTGKALNWAGRVNRAPSSAIQTIDEFMRQVASRQALESKLYRDALDKLVNEEIRKTQGGRLTFQSTEREKAAFRAEHHHLAKKLAESEFNKVIKDGRIRNEQVIQQELMQSSKIQSIEDPFEQAMAITEGMSREWNPRHIELVRFTEDYATRPVFQGELGPIAKSFQNWMDTKAPIMRLLIPFYRTPMKILERFAMYSPTATLAAGATKALNRVPRMGEGTFELPEKHILPFHKKHMEDLRSGDPVRRSEAMGRQVVGTSILGASYLMMEQGVLTGGYPEDPRARDAWRRAGIQPYSLRLHKLPGVGHLFPDGMSVSLAKLDPYFMHTAILADTYQYLQSQPGLREDEEATLMTSLLHATMSIMSDRSYVQGLSDAMRAMEDPERYGQRWVNNFLTGVTPMSSGFRNFLDTQDPVVRDYVDLFEEYSGKTIFGVAGEGPEGVAPKYTPIGDVMYKRPDRKGETSGYSFTNLWNLWSPVTIGYESNDPVDVGISKMLRPPGMPRSELRGLDMREYTNDKYDHSAYTYWQEATGKVKIEQILDPDGRGKPKAVTLRKYLEEYFTEGGKLNDLYKSHFEIDSKGPNPNGQFEVDTFVNGVISDYRSFALDVTMQEFPTLRGDMLARHREYSEALRPQIVEEKGADSNEVQFLDQVIDKLKTQQEEAASGISR